MAAGPEASRAADLWQARTLLRAARVATLATQTGGQPFTALVTPATAPDSSTLLLLSTLSEHTRHLMAEPRCALMVAGAATTENPQTAPRITVTGLAELAPDPALKARWLAVHPYAALYAGFGDFALWRVRPMAGLFVGGFARATRLRQADLVPDPGSVAAIALRRSLRSSLGSAPSASNRSRNRCSKRRLSRLSRDSSRNPRQRARDTILNGRRISQPLTACGRESRS